MVCNDDLVCSEAETDVPQPPMVISLGSNPVLFVLLHHLYLFKRPDKANTPDVMVHCLVLVPIPQNTVGIITHILQMKRLRLKERKELSQVSPN